MDNILFFQFLQDQPSFDWQKFFFGDEKWMFIFEVMVRTLVMFTFILTCLRLLGKRGIKQLSVFELGVIIALGSAAGDPMFYKDVGLVFGILVLLVVVMLYRLLTYLTDKSEKLEKIVEGSPTYVVKNGKFINSNMENETISHPEFFAQLRVNNISHLGQVQLCIIEATGELSVFFFPDENVKYGLPILPHLNDNCITIIAHKDIYACHTCGEVQTIEPITEYHCPVCNNKNWVKAIDDKRIT